MSVKAGSTREEQADATRAALVAVARKLFARRGYPDVAIDEIVQAARVTKGALYHHFADKRELFRAVVVDVETSVRSRLEAAASRPDRPLDRLRAACAAYLDACVDEEVGRIVVLDAPAVLGWEAWCRIEKEHGLGFFVGRLRAIRGDDPGVESGAQMLLGALNVAGRVIAQAEDRRRARAEASETIDRLLEAVAKR